MQEGSDTWNCDALEEGKEEGKAASGNRSCAPARPPATRVHGAPCNKRHKHTGAAARGLHPASAPVTLAPRLDLVFTHERNWAMCPLSCLKCHRGGQEAGPVGGGRADMQSKNELSANNNTDNNMAA